MTTDPETFAYVERLFRDKQDALRLRVREEEGQILAMEDWIERRGELWTQEERDKASERLATQREQVARAHERLAEHDRRWRKATVALGG